MLFWASGSVGEDRGCTSTSMTGGSGEIINKINGLMGTLARWGDDLSIDGQPFFKRMLQGSAWFFQDTAGDKYNQFSGPIAQLVRAEDLKRN